MRKRSGEGRGLESFEVALIKTLWARGMARDYIMSLIIRPGRVVSPAVVNDINIGRIGPNIDPASDAETDLFIETRMAEARPITAAELGGPASQMRVNQVLRIATGDQGLFSTHEGRIVEFKEFMPSDKEHRGTVAKTMAAFANTGGGYVVFGIRDDRTVVGLADPEKFARGCDTISDVITHCFCPVVTWDKNVIEFQGVALGIIYVYELSQKPTISMVDFGQDIKKSNIYVRYEGKTQRIEPGDLVNMMAAMRVSVPSGPAPDRAAH